MEVGKEGTQKLLTESFTYRSETLKLDYSKLNVLILISQVCLVINLD